MGKVPWDQGQNPDPVVSKYIYQPILTISKRLKVKSADALSETASRSMVKPSVTRRLTATVQTNNFSCRLMLDHLRYWRENKVQSVKAESFFVIEIQFQKAS